MQLVKGRGVYVWDSEGRRYIDGLASLWNVAIGHGRPAVAKAAAKQMQALEVAPTLLGFSSQPAEELATSERGAAAIVTPKGTAAHRTYRVPGVARSA